MHTCTEPTIQSAHGLITARIAELQALLEQHRDGTVSGEDPEDLHLMRTSTRRLRANLRLCRGALPRALRGHLQHELAWLARLLGPVRDLDVLIQEIPRLLGPVEDSEMLSVRALLALLERERSLARAPLGPALLGPRFEALLTLLDQDAAGPRGRRADLPARDLLAPRLAGLLRDLLGGFRTIGSESSDEQLHQLRILGKRLRYGCELASLVLPLEPYTATLKMPHDMLGEHQDAVVASAWVRHFVSHQPQYGDVGHAWLATLATQRQRLRAGFLAQLPQLLAALGDPDADPPRGLAEVLLG
jgi:CHAD domain-containing protein